MKNKFKKVVLLAIILTLALLAFTGCTTINRRYNVDDIGTVTISDAIEEALQSCVIIQAQATAINLDSKANSQYSYIFVGVAISETEVIIPYQAVPKNGEYRNIIYKGIIAGNESSLNFRLDYSVPDYAFAVLELLTPDVKLKAVKFANSDNLILADLLFGVEFSKPYKIGVQSLNAYDYMRVNSVMVSSKFMVHNYQSTGHKELEEVTFTAQAYSVVSEPSYKHNFSLNSYGTSTIEFSLINNILFNKAGEFIGLNYMKKVDSSNNNEHIVDGITYAVKSNAIKQIIEQ